MAGSLDDKNLNLGGRVGEHFPPLGRLGKWMEKPEVLGYILLAPAIIFLLVFLGYPFIQAIWLTMLDKEVGVEGTFVGLNNYIVLWQDSVYRWTVVNALIFTTISVLAKLILGMLGALVMNQAFFLKNFFRGFVLLPWIIPSVLSALIWLWMFDDQYGVIGRTLMSLGLIDDMILWLTDWGMALTSIIIVNVWRGTPFFIVSLLAALQTVPKEQYEAAEIDGAGLFSQFLHVTLPNIKHVLIIVTLFGTIWTISDFNIIYVITHGGPADSTHVFSTLAHQRAFDAGQMSEGIAISFTMFPILFIILFIRFYRMRKEED
ncbi:MAG: ABC transporter permease [Nitrospinae bacterium]|nr:ABC transporter permease [Nitrospinota bacterium]|tara:strand:+ start:5043 stop:5996 length:954 start_codon:yes stop_codon:yes gene_type:complete